MSQADYPSRMNFTNTRTAVLLFALPDSVEAGRKRVAQQSEQIWRALRTVARTKVQAAGLPLLESNRLIDHQGTFGAQLSAALSAVFAEGYERVICLGNDCPDLSVTDLKRAANALHDGLSPMGPDRRGGVYLIGVNRAHFDAHGLAQLPWQTHFLADALRGYLARQGCRIFDLPVRADLNQRVDALAIGWQGRVGHRLLIIVRQALIAVCSPLLFPAPNALRLLPSVRRSGRAPPFFS